MKKIAILGASYLQLPLVLKARELGIETHCFAWDNAEAVCKDEADYFYPVSVLETEKILTACRAIGIDGITTIATDICVPTICAVAEKLGLTANSVWSGFVSTNKSAMREAFVKNGIDSPKFTSVNNYNRETFGGFSFPLIVKPTDRSGSRGVSKVGDHLELKAAIETSIGESLEKKAIVEEFIEGTEVSVECISWKGQHYLLAITDKITTGAPHFVELEHHQPSHHTAKTQLGIKEATFAALDALDIAYGASHSEFKITKEGKIVAIEVGARMGGDFIGSHLVQLSTGYDFLKGVLDVALNQFETPDLRTAHFSGVYFLCKESESLLPYFERKNSFDFEKKILKTDLHYISNSNDRSGYLIYQDSKKITLP